MKKLVVKGFTLIELLVVIAIIALLASIILASLNTARGKGRDANRIQSLQEMAKAIALADTDPAPNIAGCTGGVSTASASTVNVANCTSPSFASYQDPSAPVAAGATNSGMCIKTSAAPCQYSIHLQSGLAGQPTTQNYEICTYLEYAVTIGGTSGNIVSVNSNSNTGVVAGCN